MKIAILGATSEIAKDLILSFFEENIHDLTLFARRPKAVEEWLKKVGIKKRYQVNGFEIFSPREKFDVIINFVGVGNPQQALLLGQSIIDITLHFDNIVLGYLESHPDCRYIFLSSGAVFGSNLDRPVDENTKALIPLNTIDPGDWYCVAKLHAEYRHRALPHLSIVDIRIFNYFSHTQNINSHFLIMDILRSIKDRKIFVTTSDNIFRDYMHPSDFRALIDAIILGPKINIAIDGYSKNQVDKFSIINFMKLSYGLKTQIKNSEFNNVSKKSHYYSLNRRAREIFNYSPVFSSIDGIKTESIKLFSKM